MYQEILVQLSGFSNALVMALLQQLQSQVVSEKSLRNIPLTNNNKLCIFTADFSLSSFEISTK